ncbi:hypothetical protein ABPG75_003059 [Micractinium tetrahymenae]
MAEAAPPPPPAPTGTAAGTAGGTGNGRLLPGELSFQTLVGFVRSIRRVRGRGSQAQKEAMVQGFIRDNIVRESGQAWDVFRLLLPHLDTHRPPHMLQEARLGTALLRAAAIPEGSDRWWRIKGWIDPLLADKHTVGQFAEVLSKSLFQDHCAIASGTPQARRLKVRQVNDFLDRLSAASGESDLLVPLLRELYHMTTPQQLKQLVQIIQRDFRYQLSETYIFPRWHPDAEACYAHCYDARQVFNGLCDPAAPFQARLELGRCAQPQLSLAMYSSRALVEKMQQMEARAQTAAVAEAADAAAGAAAADGGNGSGSGGGKGSGRSGGGKGGVGRGGARAGAAASGAGQQGAPVHFLVEIKLDGERQQIHMPADPSQHCNYFSRRGIDHGPHRERQGGGHFHCFDPVVRAQVRAKGAILDGELLNWNKRKQRFEVFGSWRSVIRALNEGGMPTDLLDCTDYEGNLNVEDADWEAPMLKDLEACYVCWDILWADGRQLSQLPLLERQCLLRQTIRPAPPEGIPLVPTNPSAPHRGALWGRIVLLLPGEACYPGVPVPCVCSTVAEMDEAIKEVMDKRMEGIVAKRLSSPWTAGDRSGSWIKFKPDYVRKVELDAVVIGVWHGERERSGKYGEFLLGIRCCPPHCQGQAERGGDDNDGAAEGGSSGSSSYKWASFVKVGAGLKMAEMEQLTAILEPNTCEQPPACYRLTGHHKERPHLFIKNPLESVVLEVQADLRLVCSTYYASEYSLRFPRVERIRWDKGALQASDEEDLRSRARSRKERLVQEEFRYVLQHALWETMRTPGKTRKALESEVPRRRGRLALGACQQEVKVQSSVLKGCCLFILNYAGHDRQHFQKLVRQMGGNIWSVPTFEPARVGSSYTHVLAGAPLPAPGFRPRDCEARNWRLAATSGCDVLGLGWLAACFAAGQLVAPAAADYLQVSPATLQEHPSWDPFGDDYFCKATAEDLAAALLRMPAAEALEAGCALQGWLEGQQAQVAALTQQQGADGCEEACCSAGEEGEEILEDECLLLRHIARLAAGQAGSARLAAELAAGVDAELAALGLLDASALMHGCRVAVVQVPLEVAGRQRQQQQQQQQQHGAQAEADLQAASGAGLLAGVTRLQAEAQQYRARLASYAASSLAGLLASHGGSVSSRVDEATTHLLAVQSPGEPGPAARAAVAEAAAALAAAAQEQAAADGAEQAEAATAAAAQAAPPQPPALSDAEALMTLIDGMGKSHTAEKLRRRLAAGQLQVIQPREVPTLKPGMRQLVQHGKHLLSVNIAAAADGGAAAAAAAESALEVAAMEAKAAERAAKCRAALLAAAARAAAGSALPPVEPAALLAAVSEQAGGLAAVAALQRRLQAGRLAVVRPSWVEASVEAAAQRAGLPLPPAAESEHAVVLAGGAASPAGSAAAAAADCCNWPWARFAAASPPTAAAAVTALARAGAEVAAEEAEQPWAEHTEATSSVQAGSLPAEPAAALAAALPAVEEAAPGPKKQLAAGEAGRRAVEPRALDAGPVAGAAAAAVAAAVAPARPAAASVPQAAAAVVAPRPGLAADSAPRKAAAPPSPLPAPVSKPGSDRRLAKQAEPQPAPEAGALARLPAKRPRQAEERSTSAVGGRQEEALETAGPAVRGRPAAAVSQPAGQPVAARQAAVAQLAAAPAVHAAAGCRTAGAAAAVAAVPTQAAVAAEGARRGGGFGRRGGRVAMQTAAAAARHGAAGVPRGSQHAQQTQQPQLAPQPELQSQQAPEQQAGKRRRVISSGLPREQQVGRSRCVHQQAPPPQHQHTKRPQLAMQQAPQAQQAQLGQEQNAAQPPQAQAAADAPAQPPAALAPADAPAQAAPAPAVPSLFDMLFGGAQPSHDGAAAAGTVAAGAGAAAAAAAVRARTAPASRPQAAPPSLLPAQALPAPAAVLPSVSQPARAAASQEAHQEAWQQPVPQRGPAAVPGGRGGKQAGVAAGQGLRCRMATLQALSQRQEEERTRREVAEASQGWSQASQHSL